MISDGLEQISDAYGGKFDNGWIPGDRKPETGDGEDPLMIDVRHRYPQNRRALSYGWHSRDHAHTEAAYFLIACHVKSYNPANRVPTQNGDERMSSRIEESDREHEQRKVEISYLERKAGGVYDRLWLFVQVCWS